MITSEKKGSKIGAIVRACRIITKMSAGSNALKSDALYYQMLANYYNRLLKAEEEGRFIAAHTVFFPSEILYAMDIVPMHTEMSTWMMAMFLGNQAIRWTGTDWLNLWHGWSDRLSYYVKSMNCAGLFPRPFPPRVI